MLDVAFYLRSHQTRVYLLCAGTYILPDTMLGVAFCLRSHHIRVYSLHAMACPAQPSALLPAFTALRPEFSCCMSGLFSFTSCFCGNLLVFSKRLLSLFLLWLCIPNHVLLSSKFMIWVFELLTFKLWTLLTEVHTIIDSTFSNSLHSMISRFDLHSNELTDMHLGLIIRRSYMDLPNLGLRPLCCAKLFWGWGILLEISSFSPSS